MNQESGLPALAVAMAFFLPAAFADINIDKSRSIYY